MKMNKSFKVIVITLLFVLCLLFTGCSESITYQVKFVDGDDEISIVNVDSGNTISSIELDEKQNYEFLGWYNGDNCFEFSTPITSDLTLTAKWKLITYTVIYDINGGSGSVEDDVFTPNMEYTVQSFNVSRHHTVFTGWEYNGELYQAGDKVKIKVNEDVRFVAKYETLYTITFDANTGVGSMDSYNEARNGLEVTLTKNTYTKEGYVFLGWSEDATAKVATFTDEEKITYQYTKDVTLYAIWREDVDSVEETKKKINALGDITYGSVEAIAEARDYYNHLTEEQKAKISSEILAKLENAEITVTKIYIDVLNNDTYSANDVTEARKLYDVLTDTQKQNVETIETLLTAEYMSDKQEKYNDVNNHYQDVLMAVAYSYLYNGNQNQYDQYNYRRNINIASEEATSLRKIYLDCSSFANTVYYHTFGINIVDGKALSADTVKTKAYDDYAKDNVGKSDVLYYVETSKYTTTAAQTALLDEIKSILQVGDVITYRHGESSGSSGHVMIYAGNNKLIHCTGTSISMTVGSYNPANFVDKQTATESASGSVIEMNLSDLTSSSGSRYLFKSTTSDTCYSFSVIRPMNRTGLKLTDYAINKYLSSEINFEQSASVNLHKSVRLGDTITYTITLQNKGKNLYKNLYVKEVLPENVEYVEASMNGIYIPSTRAIYWQIPSMTSNATTTITYKVKVSSETKYYNTSVTMNEGSVCGIGLNEYSNPIEHVQVLNKVGDEATKLVGQTYTNSLDFVKDVYKNAWGVDILSNADEASNVLLSVLSYWALKQDSDYIDYLVDGCYGGIKFNSKNSLDNSYIKLLRTEYLQTGDIIIAQTSYGDSTYQCYLYLGTSLIMNANSGSVVKNATSSSTVTNLITSFEAYDRFIVLRPSLVF